MNEIDCWLHLYRDLTFNENNAKNEFTGEDLTAGTLLNDFYHTEQPKWLHSSFTEENFVVVTATA